MAGANIDYTTTCHCGQPLHYSDVRLETIMKQIVLEHGPLVRVQVSGRTWRVPRHFIALHGIRGCDIDQQGFEEVHEVN